MTAAGPARSRAPQARAAGTDPRSGTTGASATLLLAARELLPELVEHPERLENVAAALAALTDALLGLVAAGELSDETLRALAGFDGATERLASALHHEARAPAGPQPRPTA